MNDPIVANSFFTTQSFFRLASSTAIVFVVSNAVPSAGRSAVRWRLTSFSEVSTERGQLQLHPRRLDGSDDCKELDRAAGNGKSAASKQ